MDEFLEWLKEETLAGVWSKGVALSRNSKSVERLSPPEENNELKFKILTTERVLAFQVTLWPKDQDAHCNCDSKIEPCHHVVAVALAVQLGLVQEAGTQASALAPTLRYTWLAESGGMNPLRKLTLKRELIVEGKARRLEGSLVGLLGGIQSGRIQMAAPSTTTTDLKLDEIFAKASPTWNEIFKALADLPALASEGIEDLKLKVDPKPRLRKLVIEDTGSESIRILEKTSESLGAGERFQNGIFRLGDTLFLQDGGHARFETKTVSPAGFEPFLRETLPQLKNEFELENTSRYLPEAIQGSPRIEFHTHRLGDEFSVTPRLVYPEAGPKQIALRDLNQEQALLKSLREKLLLQLGVPSKISLKSAIELSEKLKSLPALGFQRANLDSTLGSYFQKEAGLSFEEVLADKETLLKLLALKEGSIQKTPVFLDMLRSFQKPETSELGKSKPIEVRSELWAKLRDYQKVGVEWLDQTRQRFGGAILADDMGLGKTVQTLALLQSPSLVVMPTSLLKNWRDEAARFRPDLKIQTYHGSDRTWDTGADLTLTTYSLLRLEADHFREKKWETVVLDEAHIIRNPETQAAIATFQLEAKSRIALTGTPIQNRKRDLLSLFQFIRPDTFEFEEQLEPKLIAPFVLRRTKSEVLTELPPKTYLEHSVQFTADERKFYDTVWTAAKAEIVARLDLESGSALTLFEVLLRARQACDHSGLVDREKLSGSSSKITELLALIEELIEAGQSVLVYSQWTQFLNRLELEVKPLFKYVRLDGSTKNRGDVVDEFQNSDTPTVFLLSLHAGGVGLNLTRASQVIFCEPWWNPFVELQAEDRAYRMGQNKPVTIHRLICENTIEEKIRELQKEKLSLGEAVFKASDIAKLL
ncbi:MAG: DEAD/DEAH box helicase [Bdellovibrionales bacterium]|nr:DEAD/DEAH box helicase [Oligoflexia bacterium]